MIFRTKEIPDKNLDLIISSRTRNNELEKLLLIVPTNRLIRDLKKELIQNSSGGYSSTLNLDTLSTLSEKIFRQTHDVPGKQISEPVSMVILKQSFQNCKLDYFSSFKSGIPTGTLKRIKNVISEYKRHGITPELLRLEAENLSGSEKKKALELADVYEDYSRRFYELSLFETGDIYQNIISLKADDFNQRFGSLFPQVDLIIIKGFDEFTSIEIEILNRLMKINGVAAYLDLDYDIINNMVFEHMGKTFKLLVNKGFQYSSNIPFENPEFIARIKKNLFLDKTANGENSVDKVYAISAGNKEKEIEFIAKKVKSLLLGEVEPSKICVVFNLISNYSDIIRDQFQIFGIPFNLTDRKHLNDSPLITAFFNLLEIVEHDFYYKSIFRAFSYEPLNIFNINLTNLQKASVERRIISGYENWQRLLNSDEGTGKYFYHQSKSDIRKIRLLLSGFLNKMTVTEFRNNIYQLFDKLKLYKQILISKNLNIEEDLKAFISFTETLDETLYLIELEKPNGSFPLKYYLTQLRTAIDSSRYNIREKAGNSILVTTLNEIRGLKFDYVFIGGMNDGEFPTRYSPEIFYSGSFLRKEEHHSAEERYHFYQALCSWKKELYLSYALSDGNKELTKSTFLNEIVNLFGITERSADVLKDKLYSFEENLTLGGNLFKRNGGGTNNLTSDMRSLELDHSRLRNRDNEFNGNLSLGKITLDYEEFSITQLENYAKCPFKYYSENILRLKTIEEPSEEIEAKEMGIILHFILSEFYKILSERWINLTNASTEEIQFAEQLLFSIASKRIEEEGLTSSVSFFEKEKILGINGNRKDSILYHFFTSEINDKSGFVPFLFEVPFGGEIKVEAGKVCLKGKIDRIDVNSANKTFRVIDYKLNKKVPTASELTAGTSLQIPLYLIAAAKIIKHYLQEEYTPSEGMIYSLKFNEKDFGLHRVRINKSTDPAIDCLEMINNAIEVAGNCIAGILKGDFHLSTLIDREEKVCKFCNYNKNCRIKELD